MCVQETCVMTPTLYSLGFFEWRCSGIGPSNGVLRSS